MRFGRFTVVAVTIALVVWSLLIAATVPYNESLTTALFGIGGPRPVLSQVGGAVPTSLADEWAARMVAIWAAGVVVILAVGVAIVAVGYIRERRRRRGP